MKIWVLASMVREGEAGNTTKVFRGALSFPPLRADHILPFDITPGPATLTVDGAREPPAGVSVGQQSGRGAPGPRGVRYSGL